MTMSLCTHSLVAYILPIIINSKVGLPEDASTVNQDSETSEHHMPWVPAQDSTTHVDIYKSHLCVDGEVGGSITCRAHRVCSSNLSKSDVMAPFDIWTVTPDLSAR